MTRQLETREAEVSVQNYQNTILSSVSDRLPVGATTNSTGGVGLAGVEWTPTAIVAPMVEKRLLGHGSDRRLQTSHTTSVEPGTVSTDQIKINDGDLWGREVLTVFLL